MKRKFISSILLIFLIGINIHGQNTDIINFEKVYNFLNLTITNDTVKFNLSDKTDFGVFRDNTESILADTLFDNGDRDFFRQQFIMSGKVKWIENKINGAKIISHGKIKRVFHGNNGWNKFRKKYGGCLTEFSLPIFDKKYNYCIFYHWTQCDYLSGRGSIDLYKFENGKWIFIRSYMTGIS